MISDLIAADEVLSGKPSRKPSEKAPRKSRLQCKLRRMMRRFIARHIVALYRHPAEYVVALLITIILASMGDADKATVSATWLYAIVKTAVAGAEG